MRFPGFSLIRSVGPLGSKACDLEFSRLLRVGSGGLVFGLSGEIERISNPSESHGEALWLRSMCWGFFWKAPSTAGLILMLAKVVKE